MTAQGQARVILTGDINLMNVADPDVPFCRVADRLAQADLVFANLECMLHRPAFGHCVADEGFFADPEIGSKALQRASVAAVGIANNINYGEEGIRGSIANLDALGILHTGAGVGRAAARAPIILERNGVRIGFLQRSSVYWSTNHEAGETGTGIAVLRGHTAYQVPMYKTRAGQAPFNRPGIPPVIVTWADRQHLEEYAAEVAALKAQVDVVVASCHWGLAGEVYDYMQQIAQTAIDSGADIVLGHGPHHPLPLGSYKGRPIFYGVGSFSFHTGHDAVKHGDWIGLMVEMQIDRSKGIETSFSFVRHNDANETVPRLPDEEAMMLKTLSDNSAELGARLVAQGDSVLVEARETIVDHRARQLAIRDRGSRLRTNTNR